MREIFIVEFVRTIKELKSYKVNMILANISILIMFFGLLSFSSSDISAKTQVFTMLGWYVFIHGISSPTYIVEEEMLDETIVNILNSQKSLYAIIILRMLIQIIFDIIKVFLILLLISFATNLTFSFGELLLLFSLIVIVSISSTLLGITLASFTLLYNKTSHVIGVFYYFILFFSGGLFSIQNNFILYLNYFFPYLFYTELLDYYSTTYTLLYKNVLIIIIQLFAYYLISKYLLKRNLIKLVELGGNVNA